MYKYRNGILVTPNLLSSFFKCNILSWHVWQPIICTQCAELETKCEIFTLRIFVTNQIIYQIVKFIEWSINIS